MKLFIDTNMDKNIFHVFMMDILEDSIVKVLPRERRYIINPKC